MAAETSRSQKLEDPGCNLGSASGNIYYALWAGSCSKNPKRISPFPQPVSMRRVPVLFPFLTGEETEAVNHLPKDTELIPWQSSGSHLVVCWQSRFLNPWAIVPWRKWMSDLGQEANSLHFSFFSSKMRMLINSQITSKTDSQALNKILDMKYLVI